MVSRKLLRNSRRGFTLVELMVTIAIAAVLAMVAAPAFQSQLANQRQQSAARDLVRSISEARSLAVLQRRNVELWAAYPNGTQWNGPISTPSTPPIVGTGSPANTIAADLTALQNQSASWYLVMSGSIAPLGQGGSVNTIANVYPLTSSVSRGISIVSNLVTDKQALRFQPYGTVVQVKGSVTDTTASVAIPPAGVQFTICPVAYVGSGEKRGSVVTVTSVGVARISGAQAC